MMHFAELQGTSRSGGPFRLAVLREIAPPKYSGFCELVIALEQECQIEHRIHVVWGSSQSRAQDPRSPHRRIKPTDSSVEPLGESPRFKPGGICSKTSQPRVGG